MLAVTELRNRVVEMRYCRPSEIADHPYQWRGHPPKQRQALEGALKEVGIAGALLAYHSPRLDGQLTAIDGHLRKATADVPWPTLILDVTDAEADYLLATYDPLTLWAEMQAEQMQQLLSLVDSQDTAVQALLEDLRAEAAPSGKEISDAELLKKLQVTIAEPETSTKRGDLWTLSDRHTLVVLDVVRDAKAWWGLLGEAVAHDALFCPYPGPFVPLTKAAEEKAVFMVQPDLFIAGHILDSYKRVHGDDAVVGPRRVADAA